MAAIAKIGAALNSLLRRAASARPLTDPFANGGLPGDMEPLGPGTPIAPQNPRGYQPRTWIYPPGINIAQAPRTLPGLRSFQDLRNFAAGYDVLRICIELRKQQLRGLKWDVVVRDPSRSRGSDFSADIDRAVAFFSHPDGRMPFTSWLNAALEDLLVIDALTIYKRRDRAGRLLALELIDGATIKPLIDQFGRAPAPPAPAYQQFVYGFPWADFGFDEILYRPYNPRTFVNYGYSPVEQIVVTITVGMSREIAAINYYKEGNTPAGFGEVPKEWSAAMIREFEEIFNGLLAGDFAARARIKMVPAGFNFKPWVESGTTFNSAYDEYLARIVSAAFGVPPTLFVHTFNRATAQAADDATTVAGFDPLKEFVERLCDELLVAPDGLGMPQLRFTFTTEKRDDEQLQLQKNVEYLKAGVLSIDDVLVQLGMEPIGVGRFITVPGQGVVALDKIFPGELNLERKEDPTLAPAVMSDAERADLGKWLRKARRTFARQPDSDLSAADFGFASDAIGASRRSRIEIGLSSASSIEQVNLLFDRELGPASLLDVQRDGSESDRIAGQLHKVLERTRRQLAEIVLARSGIGRDGFATVHHLSWLHDRVPLARDLTHATSEYFDDDDFRSLDELVDPLAGALRMRPHLSAGFPRVADPPATPTQFMRPGAHPLFERDGDDEHQFDRLAHKCADRATALTRARLNRLIDLAHERDFTRSELRDAVLRAQDFSSAAARELLEQAAQQPSVES